MRSDLTGNRATLTAAMTIAALSCTPVTGIAAWEGINHGIGVDVVYLDRGSIRNNGAVLSARVMFDFSKAFNSPRGFELYRSVEDSLAIRCADREYAREKETLYSGLHGRGTVIGQYTWEPDELHFEPAVPFTNSAEIVDYTCRDSENVAVEGTADLE
jgi:hypothetical protein